MSKNNPIVPILLTEEEKTIFSDHSRTIAKTKKRKRKGPKKSRKQISGKKFFLTFPQCSVKPELALTRLIFKYPNLKWAIVAREKHSTTEGLHLHVVFWLNSMVRYRNVDQWDFIAGKHGNYQIAKNIVKVVKYVTKDNEYVAHNIDVQSWLLSKMTKKGASFEAVAHLMRDGKSIEDIEELHPGMVCNNLQKLQRYKKFLVQKKRKNAAKELEKWKTLNIVALDQDFRTLGIWMNNNLGTSTPRPFKMKQLWLWGCSNLGKTSLIMKLRKYFRIYMVPMDTKTLDDYEDNQYDLIVLDEYKGQKSITWMNGFVQGDFFPIHRRYVSTVKEKNLPVIVLSNYDISGAYGKVNMFNPERLNSLKNRFEEINVLKFIKVL